MSNEKRQLTKYKHDKQLDFHQCQYFRFQRLFRSDAKGRQMTSSIEPLLVMPSTSPSSHTNMASSDISTTSATPPSHLAILSIKGFVVPSDNYSDISRQALASESPIRIVCFGINHIHHIVRYYPFLATLVALHFTPVSK